MDFAESSHRRYWLFASEHLDEIRTLSRERAKAAVLALAASANAQAGPQPPSLLAPSSAAAPTGSSGVVSSPLSGLTPLSSSDEDVLQLFYLSRLAVVQSALNAYRAPERAAAPAAVAAATASAASSGPAPSTLSGPFAPAMSPSTASAAAGVVTCPDSVLALAMAYFRRFYLIHSSMEVDPKPLLLSCLLLASKADDRYIRINDIQRVTGVSGSAIVRTEADTLQGISFQLRVFLPFRAKRGILAAFAARAADAAEDAAATAASAPDAAAAAAAAAASAASAAAADAVPRDLAWVSRLADEYIFASYYTDAVFTAAPSQIALASVTAAASALAEGPAAAAAYGRRLTAQYAAFTAAVAAAPASAPVKTVATQLATESAALGAATGADADADAIAATAAGAALADAEANTVTGGWVPSASLSATATAPPPARAPAASLPASAAALGAFLAGGGVLPAGATEAQATQLAARTASLVATLQRGLQLRRAFEALAPATGSGADATAAAAAAATAAAADGETVGDLPVFVTRDAVGMAAEASGVGGAMYSDAAAARARLKPILAAVVVARRGRLEAAAAADNETRRQKRVAERAVQARLEAELLSCPPGAAGAAGGAGAAAAAAARAGAPSANAGGEFQIHRVKRPRAVADAGAPMGSPGPAAAAAAGAGARAEAEAGAGAGAGVRAEVAGGRDAVVYLAPLSPSDPAAAAAAADSASADPIAHAAAAAAAAVGAGAGSSSAGAHATGTSSLPPPPSILPSAFRAALRSAPPTPNEAEALGLGLTTGFGVRGQSGLTPVGGTVSRYPNGPVSAATAAASVGGAGTGGAMVDATPAPAAGGSGAIGGSGSAGGTAMDTTPAAERKLLFADTPNE
jgi:hypothetical protein